MQGSLDSMEPKREEPEGKSSTNVSHAYDYFIEGYDLPPEEQAIRDRLLSHVPTLKTKTYRDSLLKIVASLSELDSFSDNLQAKVDNLLHSQQTTFVESYKQHINKVQSEFDKLHALIEQLQQKIRYYENEGKMSALVKKVFQLEQESTKLFKALTTKDKHIRDLELTVAMQKKEMKILQQTVKVNARQKSIFLTRQFPDTEESPVKLEDITVFATQLGLKKSSFTSHRKEVEKTSAKLPFHNNSIKSVTVNIQNNEDQSYSYSKTRQKSLREAMLSKENNKLKLRNQKLLSHQTRVVETNGQMQQFFIHCVQQLQKQIRIRKKMQYCSFNDFKKEDKLMLMIKILSNNQILTYLYERIFHKKKKYSVQGGDTSTKGVTEDCGKEKLPKIKFQLDYLQK